jgi:hypothetical protein
VLAPHRVELFGSLGGKAVPHLHRIAAVLTSELVDLIHGPGETKLIEGCLHKIGIGLSEGHDPRGRSGAAGQE